MRILHTESSMSLGGQELRTLMEMEAIKELGHTSLLVARPASKISSEARVRGLRIIEAQMHGSLDPWAVARFAWIISKERIDLVCTHGSKDGWSAGIAARLLGKRIVRTRNVANPIRSHFFGRVVYNSLCDRIITTSEFIKRGMVERGIAAERITCIPTGLDTGRFHPGVAGGAFRKELGIEQERPLVGMVSVLRGDKGPDVFVAAAELVLARLPDAFFVLVGDGWMRPALEDKVSRSRFRQSIRLTGFRRDIPSIMADLSLLALPARVPEGVPQTILQAHAMTLPVVASDVGGINEVAINGETALCVPPGEAQPLADAILAVLSDPQGARARAERGREMVLANYTQASMIERLVAVYSNNLS